jgi:sucrose-6-phosphate hydrolase SacC (GH32 family)
MKYIIDMIDDMRENIQNAADYTLLAILLKEDSFGNFQNAGEKVITSLFVDHDAKQLLLGFLDENATTKTVLECADALNMNAMMYEVIVKISDEHPHLSIIGFGENHEEKKYTFFVTL